MEMVLMAVLRDRLGMLVVLRVGEVLLLLGGGLTGRWPQSPARSSGPWRWCPPHHLLRPLRLLLLV